MKTMMNTSIFFCDTYALIEIIGGNPNYRKYLDDTLITSDYNLMELYYAFLRDYSEKIADKYFDFWSSFVVHVPYDVIKSAMKFKLDNKRDHLSYVDCIGYIFSIHNRIRFLTGDIKFENKEHTEYVK